MLPTEQTNILYPTGISGSGLRKEPLHEERFGRFPRSEQIFRRKFSAASAERHREIVSMIQQHKCVTKQKFLETLEISPATFKRDLEFLRSRMRAEIIYDRESGGYKFDPKSKRVELPGLWFSDRETVALIIMQQLLSSIDRGGLLGPHIDPLKEILSGIPGKSAISSESLSKRLKVVGMSARKGSLENFEELGLAVLNRQRIQLEYHAKSANKITTREVSPQRLIFYRDNWYLQAWCHLRNDLRSFSLDGIRKLKLIDGPAEEISEEVLNTYFSEAYGIFSGKAIRRAKLKFKPERARWVAGETWHDQQIGTFQADGSYVLEFNYNNDTELVMDILRHGASVKVLEPIELRTAVHTELVKALAQCSL